MIPHKCPVCEGRGQVPATFYGEYNTNAGIGTSIPCRSCFGGGIVWDYSVPYVPYFPYTPPTIQPINPPTEYPYTICMA